MKLAMNKILIGKRPSPLCICGKISNSLHYILKCPLTGAYHIRRDPQIPLHNWIKYILHNQHLQDKIIKCINYIEQNELLFTNPGPYNRNPLVPSSSEEDDDDD